MRRSSVITTSALAFAVACGGKAASEGAGGAEPAYGGAGGADGGQAVGGGGGAGNTSGGGNSSSGGCDKIDFLFIIDNSESMADHQQALIASFPGFIEKVKATVSAQSYHIMVVDTDAATVCTPDNCMTGATGADQLCDAANGYACQAPLFDACDSTLGAGVVHPAGDGATNAPCSPFGGNRYIVDGEPDLVGMFSCMARVGIAGNPASRPMDALEEALSSPVSTPPNTGAGICNEGFHRIDAVLVIVLISDDPDYHDADGPWQWYNAVPYPAVVLGLTPNFGGCGSIGSANGAHWSELIGMFGAQGLEASVCDDDYSPFFDQAVGIIDDTCDDQFAIGK